MRNALIGLALACLLGLATWGGTLAWHSYQCSRMEEDFLNRISSLKQGVLTSSYLAGNPETVAAIDRVKKLDEEAALDQLSAIHDQCGTRAGQTASRHASGILLGN